MIEENNNESFIPRLVDTIDNICNELITELSDSDTEVLKIENIHEENIQEFKRKYMKKWKYLSREINKENRYKIDIIELITELFKDLHNNCTNIVKDFNIILSNAIKDYNEIKEFYIRNSILIKI